MYTSWDSGETGLRNSLKNCRISKDMWVRIPPIPQEVTMDWVIIVFIALVVIGWTWIQAGKDNPYW